MRTFALHDRLNTPLTATAVLFASLCLAGPARAQALDCPASPPGKVLRVIHVNGIFTNLQRAQIDRATLGAKFDSYLDAHPGALQDVSAVDYQLAYNTDEPFLAPLLQAFSQWRAQGQAQDFWKWLDGEASLGDVPDKKRDDSIKDEWAAMADRLKSDDDLRKHTLLYEAWVAAGDKVLLVPHSQGTLYANEAYSILFDPPQPNPLPESSVGIVAVASLAGTVRANGYYSTLKTDKIVEGQRIWAGLNGTTILPWNTTNTAADSGNGHQFVANYLEGDVSLPKIMGDMVKKANELKFPEQVAMPGTLTATLTWAEATGDLDLYVTEAADTRIWYGNPQGSIGRLDIDDQDGFGPEHYFVDCGHLKAGTYEVGVNYYDENGGATAINHQATVVISAGDSTRSSTKTLSRTAKGSSAVPIPFFHIAVAVQDGKPYFDIEAIP